MVGYASIDLIVCFSDEAKAGKAPLARVGQMLVDTNLASVHARYPDTALNPDNVPGSQDWSSPYAFIPPNDAVAGGPSLAVRVLRVLSSYEYQACEVRNWETSPAREFCETIRIKAIQKLPGWEQADRDPHERGTARVLW